MPQTSTPNVTRPSLMGHPDRAAATIARKLVERHGFLAGLTRAADRWDRYRAPAHFESAQTAVVTNPARWLYWRTVTLCILRRHLPPAMEGEVALLTAIRRGLARQRAA